MVMLQQAKSCKCSHHMLLPQVRDDHMSMLQEMGYSAQEARRALRFAGVGGVEAAASFIDQQREQEAVRARGSGRLLCSGFDIGRMKLQATHQDSPLDQLAPTKLNQPKLGQPKLNH